MEWPIRHRHPGYFNLLSMANIFHPTASISQLAVIDVSSRGTDTTIGAGSVVDDFVKIKHVGGTGNIEIGEHVYLNSFTVIYSGNGVRIGNDVLIGPNCSIVPANHNFSSREMPIRLARSRTDTRASARRTSSRRRSMSSMTGHPAGSSSDWQQLVQR